MSQKPTVEYPLDMSGQSESKLLRLQRRCVEEALCDIIVKSGLFGEGEEGTVMVPFCGPSGYELRIPGIGNSKKQIHCFDANQMFLQIAERRRDSLKLKPEALSYEKLRLEQDGSNLPGDELAGYLALLACGYTPGAIPTLVNRVRAGGSWISFDAVNLGDPLPGYEKSQEVGKWIVRAAEAGGVDFSIVNNHIIPAMKSRGLNEKELSDPGAGYTRFEVTVGGTKDRIGHLVRHVFFGRVPNLAPFIEKMTGKEEDRQEFEENLQILYDQSGHSETPQGTMTFEVVAARMPS